MIVWNYGWSFAFQIYPEKHSTRGWYERLQSLIYRMQQSIAIFKVIPNLKVDTFDLGALTYHQTLSVVGTNDLKVHILEPSGVSFDDGTARSGVANRILGIQAFTSPVIIPAQPTNFDVAFKSSTGLTVINAGGGTVKLSGGPFAVKITAK